MPLSPHRRWTLALLPLLLGCSHSSTASPPPAPAPAAASAPEAPADHGRVIQVDGGQEKQLDAAEAARLGYGLVDLRDDWTPYIFTEGVAADGTPLTNRYRQVYLGLANDTTDGDGQPIDAGSHNYLELYGIPPTLSVLRARFLEDDPDRCAAVDYAKIQAVPSIPARDSKGEAREKLRIAHLARDLEQKRRQAKVATLDELAAAQPKLADDVKAVVQAKAIALAVPEIEKRLRCEGMFPAKYRHSAGAFDEAMRLAVIRFQHKNKLYESAAFRPKTMAALGRRPLDNDWDALQRVVTERATSAADVLEDGSVDGKEGAPTYESAAGGRLPVRNLVQEATDATLGALGWKSAADALAFFRRHPAADFGWLRVAVKLPAPPEYYAPHMDLAIEIDRGDVFYDPLFDEEGKPNNQTRHHFPMLTVRTKYRGHWIPLARWRTTIGGWRSDQASNGYEYYRYKGSDVGPRVWRHVVAGPVWIAPNSTPIRTLVKPKVVRGKSELVVNYDEVGPGYLSAYGLVAAYNVVPGQNGKPDWDNGVRVHGSSEYRSIYNPDGYSHGCHRLMNHLAVRLFSFVLQHRNKMVDGDQPLGFSR